MRKRPLSPHLSIYKPQITSVLSILHRITGACLFMGLMLLSLLMIVVLSQALGFGFIDIDLTPIFSNILFKLMLLGMAFCLYYHLLNGIRHLYWDLGLGINNNAVQTSGIFVIVASLVATIFTLFVAIYNHF